MSKILVTGATGNVGAEVVKLLVQSGQPVVAAVRNIERAKSQLGDKIEYVQFDFKNPATYEKAFKDINKVFLVRPPDIADIKQYVAPAIEVARQVGVKHIVFLSLFGVDKNKVVPHYKIEQAILASGLDYTFLRASFFMQNLNTAMRDDIKERGEVFVPAGKGKTSFIDVRDIAAVGVKALTEEGHQRQAYPLTGNEALDYYQVAQDLSQVLGKKIVYTKPSPLKFIWRMYRRKLPLGFVLIMTAIFVTARLGLAAGVTPDTQRLLGRQPITMRQYVEDYKQSWQ